MFRCNLLRWGRPYSLLVLVVELATETVIVVDLGLEAEGVVLEAVARLNALTLGLVLVGELLGLLDHAVNLLLSQATLVVGDGDRLCRQYVSLYLSNRIRLNGLNIPVLPVPLS